MEFPRHPVRPLASAFAALRGPSSDPRLWLPFVAVAACKALLLAGIARLDLVPAVLLWPCLTLAPSLERVLHYPHVVLQLPLAARLLDLGIFFTVGIVVQAVAIVRLARAWGANPPPVWEGIGRTTAKFAGLGFMALLLAGVPLAASQAAHAFVPRAAASTVGLIAGGLASMLLFVAPVFWLVRRLSLRASLASSIGLFPQLPVALPLAVLLLAALHAPALMLRTPAIRAGATNDPDWILAALLGQLPAEIFGGVLAAGLATYFGLRTRFRSVPRAAASVPLTLLALFAVALCVAGCDTGAADNVRLRYAGERWVERARLRAESLRESDTEPDSTAYLEVARLYGQAIDQLGAERRTQRSGDRVQQDLSKLVCQALLGRAAAWNDAGRAAASLRDYQALLDATTAYRGARADAALGLARCEDRRGDWPTAHAAYMRWLRGVQAGEWPLHADGLRVPSYVSRRLRDRGARADRQAWVDLASGAFETAAARGELSREARAARFGLLLGVQRWNEAYAALHILRAEDDPQGHDGALLVAEASLLAGGLGRQNEAVGILQGLAAEGSPYDTEHRVAGWLLLGEIHTRSGDWPAAQRDYEGALAAARSDAGRSEAMLGLARTFASKHELPAARREYTHLRELFPSTAAGLLAPLEEIRLLQASGETVEARTLVATALAGYRRVIQQFGTELPALRAARAMSECMGLGGNWGEGIAFLDSIAPSFGSDPRAGTLLAFAARLSVEQLEDRYRATRLLAALDARYPASDVAVLARAYADSLGLRTP
jgi:hypothetical protein